ncbi:MAG: hypothetical protein M3Q91_08765, partial [Acidobacteriota bacterium]|nr:hypothetical protein [Acidobacteriota bacterium]
MQRATLDHATLGIGQRLYDNERGFIQLSGNPSALVDPFSNHSSLIYHLSLITYHSSLITHHSSLITHHSSLITHH